MADPTPPSYSNATSTPSVPPPGFTNTNYTTDTGDYPPSGGYPPVAGFQPINYGSAYPPAQPTGYNQPPPSYPPSGYTVDTEPPNTYATSDPETGFGSKNNSPILSFDDKSIRLSFIRKVFGILGAQMLITTGIICLFIFHEPTKNYVQNSLAMYLSAYVLFLVLYFVLVCCSKVAKSYPANVILLGVFTLSLSYLVGVISSFHDTKIVLLLFGMTCIISAAIMVFACQTKYDFTSCGGVLFVCAISLFLFGIFAGALVPNGSVKFVNVVYASLGALLFMAFLAFDTQLIMGGRKYELSPEDYIFGAMMLYVDIIYIFLFLLQLFGGGSS